MTSHSGACDHTSVQDEWRLNMQHYAHGKMYSKPARPLMDLQMYLTDNMLCMGSKHTGCKLPHTNSCLLVHQDGRNVMEFCGIDDIKASTLQHYRTTC